MIAKKGRRYLFPSSFRTMDDKLLCEIAACDGADRIALILEKCFSKSIDRSLLANSCDFPIVEIEEDLYVLEFERAKAFAFEDEKLRPFVIAAVLISAYVDLDVEGHANLFLPCTDACKDFVSGAVVAKNAGVPFDVFVGAYDSATKINGVNVIDVEQTAVHELIRDFSDFDDYVFDPISALAAGAFACVEDEVEGTPSIIASVESPMNFAKEVLSALGVRAKDEEQAREKLETLFAVEPLEE